MRGRGREYRGFLGRLGRRRGEGLLCDLRASKGWGIALLSMALSIAGVMRPGNERNRSQRLLDKRNGS